MSLWTELYRVQVVNKMLFGIVNGSLFVRRVWTGYGGVCVQLTFGMSVNRRYGREELRSLLFFFRVSFVASFLLDVLYGVRNKSELCFQVFFKRWFWMEFSQRERVLCGSVRAVWTGRYREVRREDGEVLLYGFQKGVLCVFCDEEFFWGVPYGKRKIFLFTYDQSSYEDKSSLQAMRMCWRGSQKCFIFNVRFL